MCIRDSPTKSTTIERIPEYADVLEHLYHVKANDVVIVSSNSGRNGLVVEYTKRLKEKGAVSYTHLDVYKRQ